MPLVETVTRRGLTVSAMSSTARATWATLSNGSPIPMNTTLTGWPTRPSWRRTARYCPKISAPVRLRPVPSTPVTQNTQPTAHPVCEDRHRVVCPSIGIATASTTAPSANARASLAVPSPPRVRATMSGSLTLVRWASASRSAFGKLVISATLLAIRRASHW